MTVVKSIFANPMLATVARGAYLSMVAFMIASYAASASISTSAPPPQPAPQPTSYWIWA